MTTWLRKIVLVRSDPRLFAKVVVENDNSVCVEFFRSVADRETLELPKGAIHRAALPAQTRIFLETSPGYWRAGRVLERYSEASDEFGYSIRFPNEETIDVREEACFVRCLDRYADPSQMLAAGFMETQFFADRRRLALRRLRDLRSAAQGLVGMVSAAVELVPHQMATVRRVTNDRVQRYLLADEVGLGKTIEAGLIIRQLLLDDPSITVNIVVPNVLVEQWRSELASKCLIQTAALSVISHEDITKLDPRDAPTLLVVDEAHRLIALAKSEGDSAAFARLQELAFKAPKLLLLSATPALGDEERLLALLNLLDPASYSRTDLPGFRRRVQERQQIGRLLLTLQSGASAFVLRQQAKRATELFSDDPVVLEDASRLLAGIEDAAERDFTILSLKDHIANTYRIHQRLIRGRRTDVERWTMRARGPAWPALTHVRLFFGTNPYLATLLGALEGWRESATRACAANDWLALNLARRWMEFVAATWQGGERLIEVVRNAAPIYLAERDDLAQLLGVAEVWTPQDDRYQRATETLRDWQRELGRDVAGRPKKIACFASGVRDAQRLLAAIEQTVGSASVISLTDRGSELATAVRQFASSSIGIAVIDGASEEGLNLQFVHGILHLDLAFDATRVEQRIGRLDRFGRRLDKIEHRIFLPSDDEDAPWSSWFQLLANGFQVFNRSINDAQFRIKSLEDEIALKLFHQGAYAVDDLTEEILNALTEERRLLDEQHALDGLANLLDAGDELLQTIEASEEDEAELAADVEPWIRQVMGLRMERVGEPAAKTLEIAWSKDIQIPDIPWRSALAPALHNRWTWHRSHVLQPKSSASQLLRPGSTLVEVLERLACWDDRGLTYATWRVEPRWAGVWRGFRLVWLVEAGLQRSGAVYARPEDAELTRRAETFFPLVTVEQCVDESGTAVTDEDLLNVIRRPYRQQRDERGRFDVNLGSRPEWLQQAVHRGEFAGLIEGLIAKLRGTVLQMEPVATALKRARLACNRDIRQAQRSLEVRATLGERHAGLIERPLAVELEDLQSLRQAIEQPAVRLDEIGLMVVAGSVPA
jgi:ATP-dependent helicase HepA